MRVAIFHDFLDKVGGGEKVALVLARRFQADLYTTNLRPEVVEKMDLGDATVHDLDPVPAAAPLKHILASLRFRRARAPGCDVYVFSGNWAHYAAAHHAPGVLYCHTPVRAFYDRRQATLRLLPPWQRPLFRAWTRLHRTLDRRSVRGVQTVVANSENVRQRVRRYHGRDALVVPPPVDTSKFRFRELGGFWLSVNRLYPEKRVHLQCEIFRRLPGERLKVVGGWTPGDHSAPYAASLDPPPNVEFLGEVSQDELAELYGGCRGLITTAADEDFGLTPVEAMASGKAVVATDEGGHRETVLPGTTGYLLPADADAFVATLRGLEEDALLAMRPACEARARLFDEERFVEGMRAVLEATVRGETPQLPVPA